MVWGNGIGGIMLSCSFVFGIICFLSFFGVLIYEIVVLCFCSVIVVVINGDVWLVVFLLVKIMFIMSIFLGKKDGK